MDFRFFWVILYLTIFFLLTGCGGDPKEERQWEQTTASSADYVPGEVLIGLETEGVRAASVGEWLPGAVEIGRVHLGGKPAVATAAVKQTKVDDFAPVTIVHLSLPADISVDEAVKTLQERSYVRYVEPNYRVRRAGIPNDPNFSKQWGMYNSGQMVTGDKPPVTPIEESDINAPAAWDLYSGSEEMVVAVLDSGIDYNHPDLAANIWRNAGEIEGTGIDDDGNGYIDDVRGWNFYSNSANPLDDDVDGHGTHVAGIIGAVGNNNLGIAGVNWQVQLMPLKFLDRYGSGDLAKAVSAYNYALQNGARVINASYTYPQSCTNISPSQAERDAIAAAEAAGVLVVVAAGNFGCNNDVTPFYPGSHLLENIISVAATDGRDSKITWSNYGATSVDIAAPGLNIYSTVRQTLRGLDGDYGYDYLSGTSMAAPHVAGAAGLLWSFYPDMTWQEVKGTLLATADPLDELQFSMVSGGRLNIGWALGDEPPPLQPPADLVALPGTTAITLTWGTPTLATESLILERKDGEGSDFEVLANLPVSTTAYVDATAAEDLLYSYRIKAYSDLHGESAPGEEVSASLIVEDAGNQGDDSSCFIATAAYGTPFAAEIDNLRRFRDVVLLPHWAGRAIVKTYYRWSPPVASFIARHESMRIIIRRALEPVAWLAKKLTPREEDSTE